MIHLPPPGLSLVTWGFWELQFKMRFWVGTKPNSISCLPIQWPLPLPAFPFPSSLPHRCDKPCQDRPLSLHLKRSPSCQSHDSCRSTPVSHCLCPLSAYGPLWPGPLGLRDIGETQPTSSQPSLWEQSEDVHPFQLTSRVRCSVPQELQGHLSHQLPACASMCL